LLSSSALLLPFVAIAQLYDAEILGQFALVMTTIFLPSGLVGTAIGQVYYQRAARQWAEGKHFFPLWRDMVHNLLKIGVPIYAVVALLSEFAYPLVFGDQWFVAGEFAKWMSVAACVSFVSSPMDRTCLIVRAGFYSIVWSVYRLASTVVVIWIATALEFSPVSFVKAFVVQMCMTLGIDLGMSRRFSQGRLGFFA
jgi:O-antigen/teichoic acid export membrane protein